MNKQQQLIETIHAEFDGAQDRLLKDALRVLEQPTLDIQHGERLEAVGFKNVPLAKSARDKRETIELNKSMADKIRYYNQHYPLLKFITEEELDRICEKYKLIRAGVDRYMKDIPVKNLKDIEYAQILKDEDSVGDKTIIKFTAEYPTSQRKKWDEFKEWIGGTELTGEEVEERFQSLNKSLRAENADLLGWCYNETHTNVKIQTENRKDLFIAAPKSHFNLDGLKKTSKFGFSLVKTVEIKDPVVFRYVKGGVQIITKWGLEAEDPDLTNPIDN